MDYIFSSFHYSLYLEIALGALYCDLWSYYERDDSAFLVFCMKIMLDNELNIMEILFILSGGDSLKAVWCLVCLLASGFSLL